MNIYERVKEMCDAQNISIAKLEKELKISNGAISKWANTMPRANVLYDVAKYFGTSIEYFLTGEVTPVAQELTENEKELLDLLHRFDDDRTQLKFIGRVGCVANEMQAEIEHFNLTKAARKQSGLKATDEQLKIAGDSADKAPNRARDKNLF